MPVAVEMAPYLPPEAKIVSYDEACRVSRELRAAGLVVVLAQGVFDITHIGHRDYMRLSRQVEPGRTLVMAGLENDESVKTNKGINRPINPLSDRLGMLSEWLSVGITFGYEDVPNYDDPRDFISRYRDLAPDYIAVADWDPHLGLKKWQADRAGTVLAPLSYQFDNSTTQMLQKLGYEH